MTSPSPVGPWVLRDLRPTMPSLASKCMELFQISIRLMCSKVTPVELLKDLGDFKVASYQRRACNTFAPPAALAMLYDGIHDLSCTLESTRSRFLLISC